MKKKINRVLQIVRSKSIRYILFRSKYELERRSGLLNKKFPLNPSFVNLPTLEALRIAGGHYLFLNRKEVNVQKHKAEVLVERINKILNGNILFFSNRWYPLGLNYDYLTNPLNDYRYDINQHWTKIKDFDENAGDIKFLWEPSRFECLYSIVRYDYHFDEDHSAFVLSRILDWIDKNPLNCGPNYKCSQEISLRVLNWLFALFFYQDSEALTEERWQKIIYSIYWQVEHVYKNINFSRISVRNNHAITETLTLYLVGLLFPGMPNAASWKRNGKRWFEQEIEYQFEPDGSYIQQSMNYQRVVTQLLTLGISLAEKNGERFQEVVYQRAYANLNFLYQMQDEQSGWLPNYGANDGALFFDLNDHDYRDYRPQLDALHYLLTGKTLYGKPIEDSEWYGVTLDEKYRFAPLKHEPGMMSFKDGGYFVVRSKKRMVFIRCGSFKGVVVPDQMHIDVWSNGKNVLMDGGSFMYNTDEKTKTYFSGTESENTVMLDDNGQMLKGPRFMWFYPSRIIGTELKETEDGYLFEGSMETFRALNDDIILHRTVRMDKRMDKIEICDEVRNKPAEMKIRQLWHTVSRLCDFTSSGRMEVYDGWYSNYYGMKEKNTQVEFTTMGEKITTNIIFV